MNPPTDIFRFFPTNKWNGDPIHDLASWMTYKIMHGPVFPQLIHLFLSELWLSGGPNKESQKIENLISRRTQGVLPEGVELE